MPYSDEASALFRRAAASRRAAGAAAAEGNWSERDAQLRETRRLLSEAALAAQVDGDQRALASSLRRAAIAARIDSLATSPVLAMAAASVDMHAEADERGLWPLLYDYRLAATALRGLGWDELLAQVFATAEAIAADAGELTSDEARMLARIRDGRARWLLDRLKSREATDVATDILLLGEHHPSEPNIRRIAHNRLSRIASAMRDGASAVSHAEMALAIARSTDTSTTLERDVLGNALLATARAELIALDPSDPEPGARQAASYAYEALDIFSGSGGGGGAIGAISILLDSATRLPGDADLLDDALGRGRAALSHVGSTNIDVGNGLERLSLALAMGDATRDADEAERVVSWAVDTARSVGAIRLEARGLLRRASLARRHPDLGRDGGSDARTAFMVASNAAEPDWALIFRAATELARLLERPEKEAMIERAIEAFEHDVRRLAAGSDRLRETAACLDDLRYLFDASVDLGTSQLALRALEAARGHNLAATLRTWADRLPEAIRVELSEADIRQGPMDEGGAEEAEDD